MPFIIGIDDFEIQIVGNFFSYTSTFEVIRGGRYFGMHRVRVGGKGLPHQRCLASFSTWLVLICLHFKFVSCNRVCYICFFSIFALEWRWRYGVSLACCVQKLTLFTFILMHERVWSGSASASHVVDNLTIISNGFSQFMESTRHILQSAGY